METMKEEELAKIQLYVANVIDQYTVFKINSGRNKLKMKFEKSYKLAERYAGQEAAYGDALLHFKNIQEKLKGL